MSDPPFSRLASHRSTNRAARVVGAVLMLAASLSCGVGLDEEPRSLSTTTGATSTTGSVDVESGTATAELFFVTDDSLVLVGRSVANTSLENTIAALLSGPDERQAAAGLRMAIPADGRITSAEVDRGLARLSINEAIQRIRGEEFELAIAQIVLSVTASPGVERVRFEDSAGSEIVVPSDAGGDVDEVSACDFLSKLAADDTAQRVGSRDDASRLATKRTDLEEDCA